jgi:hypothetical protein
LPQPVDDGLGQSVFASGAVAIKLIDDQHRNHQLELLLEQHDTKGHDPPLAVAPFCQIQPYRRVDQEMQHVPAYRVPRRNLPVTRMAAHLLTRSCPGQLEHIVGAGPMTRERSVPSGQSLRVSRRLGLPPVAGKR